MALRPVDEEIVRRAMSLADQVRTLRHQIMDVNTDWSLNDTFNQIGSNNGDDLAETFPNLTPSKVGNGIAALNNVVSELGDPLNSSSFASFLYMLVDRGPTT